MQGACCSLPREEISCAIYIGIYGYGTEAAEEKDRLEYVFLSRGMQSRYRIPKVLGSQIQNLLEVGESYRIYVSGNLLWDVRPLKETQSGPVCGSGDQVKITPKSGIWRPPVKGNPGKRTLKNFLALAMEPVGTVLYIFGGGWNWQDTGTGRLAAKIGTAEQWRSFFHLQDARFRYRNDADPVHSYYPSQGYNTYGYAGLDCSGYIGWAVYNLSEVQDDRPGYVIRAVDMAWTYAKKYGFGRWTKEIPDSRVFVPGDIFSIEGHVWICLGRCSDGSLVILHSTPSDSICGCPGGGVQLSGLGEKSGCEAVRLADRYMRTYYPDWSKRYHAVQKPYSRYVDLKGERTGKFSWRIGTGALADPEGYADKTAPEILKDLFRG